MFEAGLRQVCEKFRVTRGTLQVGGDITYVYMCVCKRRASETSPMCICKRRASETFGVTRGTLQVLQVLSLLALPVQKNYKC